MTDARTLADDTLPHGQSPTELPRIRRAQLFALGGAVLAAAVSAVLTIEAMRDEAVGEQRVERTMDARRRISDLDGSLRGAASGIRTYLFTKDEADLDHYHDAVASVPRQLATLSDLAAEDPLQRQNIERLRPLIAARFERLAVALQGAEPTTSFLKGNQQLMERIRAVLTDLDLEEQRLLDIRREEVATTGRTAEIVSMLGLALSLGLVLLGWWLQRHDLNREMQMNQALTLARAELERLSADLTTSNQDLDAFAGRIAHDLKNVLTPMSIAAGLIKKLASTEDNEEARLAALSEKLARVSKRANLMVDSLLAFSRAGAPVDLGAHTRVEAALREVIDGLAGPLASVGARIELEIEDVVVECPPALFQMLATNLIGNAIKFLEGMPERHIYVLARRDESWVVFTVEDSGPGIPPDAIERIFEPFYRVHGTRAPGTGIGLATVDRVARAYGGRVAVRSTLGEGTTFEVRLPSIAPASWPRDVPSRSARLSV